MPRIPLIEDLTDGPIPLGSTILVEFDPSSQWYNASLTIAAGWIRSGGTSSYNVAAQPPEKIRAQLKRLGLETNQLESEDRLRIFDWYTSSLGRKSTEKLAQDSLKVADMSLDVARMMAGPQRPTYLRIIDNYSIMARFNDEKSWIEYALTRAIPSSIQLNSSQIISVINGLHTDWVYKNLESAVDGIVDFRLDDTGPAPTNLMRIRSMRNASFEGRWHVLKVAENFEVTLEK